MNQKRHHPDIDSFYHLAKEGIAGRACQGMACFVARHLNLDHWEQASSECPRVYCLGKCYMAPASSADDERPRIETRVPEQIILSRIVDGGARTLKAYDGREGCSTLERALRQLPEEIIRSVEISGLRGRGSHNG